MAVTIQLKNPNSNTWWNIEDAVVENSLRIENILGKTIDTCTFMVNDNENDITITPMSDIKVERNGKVIFGGLITLITGKTDGAHRVYTVQCQDYTILLRTSYIFVSFIASQIYDGLQGDKARIAWAFEHATYGTLQDNPEIDARTYVDPVDASPFAHGGMTAELFDTVSLSDFMDTMCSYTNFSYYVDYEKKLHYYKRSTATTPYTLTDKALTQAGILNAVAYRDIKVSTDATALANQYLLFGTQIKSAPQTYTVSGLSGATELKLGIEQIGQNIAMSAVPGRKHITVTINGTTLSDDEVGVYGIDTASGTIKALHDVTGQKLYFDNAVTGTVTLNYTYSYDYGQYYMDDGSINQYGRRFCNVLTSPNGNAVASINHKLQVYKEQFAEPLITITLTVDSLDVGADAIDTGTWIKVENSVLGIDRYFCIWRISTRILGGDYMEYELELRSWYTEN